MIRRLCFITRTTSWPLRLSTEWLKPSSLVKQLLAHSQTFILRYLFVKSTLTVILNSQSYFRYRWISNKIISALLNVFEFDRIAEHRFPSDVRLVNVFNLVVLPVLISRIKFYWFSSVRVISLASALNHRST